MKNGRYKTMFFSLRIGVKKICLLMKKHILFFKMQESK